MTTQKGVWGRINGITTKLGRTGSGSDRQGTLFHNTAVVVESPLSEEFSPMVPTHRWKQRSDNNVKCKVYTVVLVLLTCKLCTAFTFRG